MLNFTWWVNRKDQHGDNIFEGGFLGLDNIGIFDRSAPLPTGGQLKQADSTAWMGMFCLNMLAIALELASHDQAYEDVATKFFEHFLYIANAINSGLDGSGLWNEEDGFYYDVIQMGDGSHWPMKIRSFVGLIPLFAVETLEPELLEKLSQFKKRMEWFIQYRPELVSHIASLTEPGEHGRYLLSLVNRSQLERILSRVVDENQFLSPYGLRSMSKEHESQPFEFQLDGTNYSVSYEPAESKSGMFGGNSNWRGPIWFPVNFLIIESLQKFYHYYGDRIIVEFPARSESKLNLEAVANRISCRLTRLFLKNERSHRPVYGDCDIFQNDPDWKDLVLFYEYFHGDHGSGLGASHQTGWTALVAKLLHQCVGAVSH